MENALKGAGVAAAVVRLVDLCLELELLFDLVVGHLDLALVDLVSDDGLADLLLGEVLAVVCRGAVCGLLVGLLLFLGGVLDVLAVGDVVGPGADVEGAVVFLVVVELGLGRCGDVCLEHLAMRPGGSDVLAAAGKAQGGNGGERRGAQAGDNLLGPGHEASKSQVRTHAPGFFPKADNQLTILYHAP